MSCRFKEPFVNSMTDVMAHSKGVCFFVSKINFSRRNPSGLLSAAFLRPFSVSIKILTILITQLILEEQKLNIKDFGFYYDLACDNTSGTPARVTAVHKGRFGIVSDFGEGYAQLKSKEYYF